MVSTPQHRSDPQPFSTIRIERVGDDVGHWVTCPCGTEMVYGFTSPIAAAAQANRLENYIGRTGQCHHGATFDRAAFEDES